MPSNGATKVRERSRLLPPYFDVSEGVQVGGRRMEAGCLFERKSLGHWALVSSLRPLNVQGHNRVPGGSALPVTETSSRAEIAHSSLGYRSSTFSFQLTINLLSIFSLPLVRSSSTPVPTALDAVTVPVPRRQVTVSAQIAGEVVLRTRFLCLLSTSR